MIVNISQQYKKYD